MKNPFIQLHLAVLLWGFTGILGKAIALSAPVLVWYRMGLTALIILLTQLITGRFEPIKGKGLLHIAGIGVLFAIHWICFYGAVKFASASVALICLSTAGAFLAVFNPLFTSSKFRLHELMLGMLAVVGIGCIYLFRNQGGTEEVLHFRLGLLLGIIASVVSAFFTIANKSIASKYPSDSAVLYEMGSGFLFISLLLPLFARQGLLGPLVPSHRDIWLILIMSWCCTVWPQALVMRSLKKLSSFTVTISVNMEPVYGMILAFLVFKENRELNTGFYVGMALIMTSVAVQAAYGSKQHGKRKV